MPCWYHATCRAGRAGHSRGTALPGLSWCLCAQIRTHIGGVSPNPPCSEHTTAGTPPLWALKYWGSEGVHAAGVQRRKALWRNPV